MQLKSRGVFLALAVLAMSAIAVSVASAATLPEFKPVPTKKKITLTAGTSFWAGGGGSFHAAVCAGTSATGEVTGAKTIGNLVMTYTGCKTGEGCPLSSEGAKEGEVVTKTLAAELGTVTKAQASTEVGLLLRPATKTKWFSTVGNSCVFSATVTGTLAAEVTGIHTKEATRKLEFETGASGQKIKEITLDSGITEKPELEAVAAPMGLQAAYEWKFEEPVEIT
jgi:hypothetical protein